MEKANRLNGLTFSKIRMQNQKVDALEAQGIDMIRFTVGEPDFFTPEYIKEACKKAIDENMTKYSSVNASQSARKASLL